MDVGTNTASKSLSSCRPRTIDGAAGQWRDFDHFEPASKFADTTDLKRAGRYVAKNMFDAQAVLFVDDQNVFASICVLILIANGVVCRGLGGGGWRTSPRRRSASKAPEAWFVIQWLWMVALVAGVLDDGTPDRSGGPAGKACHAHL